MTRTLQELSFEISKFVNHMLGVYGGGGLKATGGFAKKHSLQEGAFQCFQIRIEDSETAFGCYARDLVAESLLACRRSVGHLQAGVREL